MTSGQHDAEQLQGQPRAIAKNENVNLSSRQIIEMHRKALAATVKDSDFCPNAAA